LCGLAAAVDVARPERVAPWALPVLRHRGPDGEGCYASDHVVLEHCRLAIIDPSNREADQPFTDPSGRWSIVYNGELFNFRELRADLYRSGATFRTASDTEVLLVGLIHYGERLLARLRGMFAFVLWDSKQRELLAARDPLGVKPLYYTFQDGTFVAGSELRALLAHPAVARELDPEAVVEYLAFGSVSGDRTLVAGVRKLLPGHGLRLRDRGLEIFEYWDALPSVVHAPSDQLERSLLEELEHAVAASMVSDVPIGLMLSGGLDSSTIAAFAARHAEPSNLTAYSVAFGLPNDESHAAGRLAQDLGFSHREILLTKDAVGEEFEDWLRDLDVPTANPTWLAVSAIARAARADGIKVLLSGDGGDELFGGYRRWMKYLRFHDSVWCRTPAVVRRTVGEVLRPVLRGLAGDIARRAAEGGELFVGSRPFHDDDLSRCLAHRGREAAIHSPPEKPIARISERFHARYPANDYLAWMSYVALKTHLVEDYLVRLDTMGMRHSVEGRVPLLDPELTRWALGLSQEQKVNHYEQKALFRRAVHQILPTYITKRKKQGFCPPISSWATELMETRIGDAQTLVTAGLVKPTAVKTLRADGSTGASFALWALGTLDAWCDQNLGAAARIHD
jgi:asparagine synthase (glutamine-hydrolysing)